MTTENQQLAKQDSRPKDVRGWIESPDFQAQIAKALPRHLTADRMIRVALTALTRTPKLAQCTPQSVCKCLLDLSAAGLEPDGRRAHLIPYGTECTLILDYKGMAELAMRSGTVSNIHADVICDKDTFEADTGRIRHLVNYREPRGPVYAAYCLIRFKDGSEKAEVMGREEIEAIRKRSRAGNNGPWVSDWNEMAKKTAARRAFKWVPLSPEIRDAVEAEEDVIDVPAKPEVRVPLFSLPQADEAIQPDAKPDDIPMGDAPKPDTAQQKPVEPVAPAPDAKPAPDDPAAHKAALEALETLALDLNWAEEKLIAHCIQSGWVMPKKVKGLKSLGLETIQKLLDLARKESAERKAAEGSK